MRQLSALDAQFLHVESATTVGHVGGVVVLRPGARRGPRGGPLLLEDLRAVVDARLHLVPALRQRLVPVPFGLGRPYWVDDPAFDIEFHVREVSLPAPGDDAGLAEQLSRIHARPLDRSRPLWEMYLVHGLSGGRQAVYTKVHHAAIDGVSGAEVLSAIMDLSRDALPPEPPDVPWDPAPMPEPAEMLARGLVSMAQEPVEAARLLPRTLPHLVDMPGFARLPGVRLLSAIGASLAGAARPVPATEGRRVLIAPHTPLNAAITAHRRIAFGTLSFDDIRAVKTTHEMTVNDVVLAVCAGALRRWLLDHDGLPETPIVAAVPVSTRGHSAAADDPGARSSGDGETYGGPASAIEANHVAVMLVELATQLRDPAERLDAIRFAIAEAKQRYDAVPATMLRDLAATIPTALAGLALKAAGQIAGLGAFPFNLIISNVPGPKDPLYVAGRSVEHVFPLSAVSDITGALSITVFSYQDRLEVGLVACREIVPDVDDIVAHLHSSLDELLELPA